MTGMQTIIDLRRGRQQPGAVFVYLVPANGATDIERYALSPQGNVAVNIAASESLGDIDFRPLVGLHVEIRDTTNDPIRHRKAAELIAAVNPRFLVMPIATERGFTVHVRDSSTQPPTTSTVRL